MAFSVVTVDLERNFTYYLLVLHSADTVGEGPVVYLTKMINSMQQISREVDVKLSVPVPMNLDMDMHSAKVLYAVSCKYAILHKPYLEYVTEYVHLVLSDRY